MQGLVRDSLIFLRCPPFIPVSTWRLRGQGDTFRIQIDSIIRIIRRKRHDVCIRECLARIAAVRHFIGRPRHQGGHRVHIPQRRIGFDACGGENEDNQR